MPDETIAIEHAAFLIDREPVTAAAWEAVMRSPPPNTHEQYATGVTYTQAADYARRVGGRLPTEQEWLSALGDDRFVYPGLWEWTSMPGVTVGTYRLRGGAWDLCADDARSASRSDAPPGYASSYVGFRCVVVPHVEEVPELTGLGLRARVAEERAMRPQLADDSQHHLDRALAAETLLRAWLTGVDEGRIIGILAAGPRGLAARTRALLARKEVSRG